MMIRPSSAERSEATHAETLMTHDDVAVGLSSLLARHHHPHHPTRYTTRPYASRNAASLSASATLPNRMHSHEQACCR